MTIREFMRAIWEGKYFVLAAVLLVLGVSLYYLDRQEPQFQATAVVEIGSAGVAGVAQDASVSVNADPRIATSEPVVAAAAAALGFQGDPEALASHVSANLDSSSRTTDITATDVTSAEAQRIANAFAQAYVDHLPVVVEEQVSQLNDRRQAVRDRVGAVQVELRSNPEDPLALAELDANVEQYQLISSQVSSLQSITQPGQIERSATSAVSLALQPEVILAVALLAGLVAGAGIALARWALNFHVRSTAEAARAADAPVLAELYGVRSAVRDHKRDGLLPITSRMASPFTESIRELRTALQVTVTQQGCIVVLVTAADPRAPRSFIAANLAASWALSGRRTVIVAGDTRRRDLQDLLPSPGGSGRASALQPTSVPNLSLFVVNNDAMDPADYLATAEVDQIIADLRRLTDVIVIDAPPVLAAADATILGGYSDGSVVIASIGRTDRDVLREATDRLKVNDVPLTGLAVAGVRSTRRMAYASTYGRRAMALWGKPAPQTNRTPEDDQGDPRRDVPAGSDQVAAAHSENPARPEERPTAGVNRAYVGARHAGSDEKRATKASGVASGPNSLRPAPRTRSGLSRPTGR